MISASGLVSKLHSTTSIYVATSGLGLQSNGMYHYHSPLPPCSVEQNRPGSHYESAKQERCIDMDQSLFTCLSRSQSRSFSIITNSSPCPGHSLA